MKPFALAAAIAGMTVVLGACAGTPEPGDPELVVDGVEWECRRIHEVGTRLGKKTCASPDVWAERDAKEAEMAAETSRRIRERGTMMPSEGGMGN